MHLGAPFGYADTVDATAMRITARSMLRPDTRRKKHEDPGTRLRSKFRILIRDLSTQFPQFKDC